MNELDCIKATIKTGNEKLTFKNKALDFSLLDFWSWSVSDILSNATRGIFAEFIDATAAKINLNEVRDDGSKQILQIVIIKTFYFQFIIRFTFSHIPYPCINAHRNQ
jgi:hypothetical protein